ncbi:hypothetical protein EV363DRAFT_1588210 [Boletus edulis]|uniref:Ribonuclease H1 N-terminal domain-containing protein n=1 Tax=Boletus edulis BED1 TaxID=1328754 RepID=A0AAD4BGE5_BOLED|nr:hypothetical protein EV363DRAFT_1588210 [Boletus edulis]KAF8426832.1 hypothetical protein L210DRAFT_3652852 [Boletus edulis BED1]
MSPELELINELLARLALCTETACHLTQMLQRDSDFTDVSSLLTLGETSLSSDDEWEARVPRTSRAKTDPTARASTKVHVASRSAAVAISAPTPAPTPTLPLVTPTPEVPTSIYAGPVQIIDPTGPHHLFVPGGLSKDGYIQSKYNNFIYDLPPMDTTGQLYLVTRGRRVGVFAQWSRTSPLVNRVRNAVYMKVSSLDEGIALVMEAIDSKQARWVK